jgi:hypothetical protein
MLSTPSFGLACAVAVFVCLAAAPVSAQPLDRRTLVTFSGPVTTPTVTSHESGYGMCPHGSADPACAYQELAQPTG